VLYPNCGKETTKFLLPDGALIENVKVSTPFKVFPAMLSDKFEENPVIVAGPPPLV
jgi:hypothetical protein